MMNFHRRFSADHRDRDFAPALERVELHGRLRSAAWPPLCANCCAPARSRLVVKKIFRRQPGGRYLGHGWKYVIRSARIPYCPSCMARNAEIVASERMPFLELVVRLVATPLVIPFVGGMIMARVFLPDTITKPIGDPLHNVGLAIVAAALLATGISVWGSWHATSFHLVPAENEITSACTFSDELGELLTGWHRGYAFRNHEFAQAFIAANQNRLWTTADTVRTGRIRFVTGLLLLASLIVGRLLLVHS